MSKTYSFRDYTLAISGPGIDLVITGSGREGVDDEGITVSRRGDKNELVSGADGGGQHNMHADESRKISFTLLKTNNQNVALQKAYNFQSGDPGQWGDNTIKVKGRNGDAGDFEEAAFIGQPEIKLGKKGESLTWEFDCIRGTQELGTY